MTYFKSGTWNCICAVCGEKVKSDEIKKRWDGLLVCQYDYEPRHVADFIRPIIDQSDIPFAAPRPQDVFIELSCPYPTILAMADIGTADCARVGIGWGDYEHSTSAIANIAIAEVAIAAPEPF